MNRLIPLVLFFSCVVWPFKTFAQSVNTLYEVTGTIYASSTVASSSANLAIDGNLNTSWVSDNPFPNLFYANSDQNMLLNKPLSTPSGINLLNATDGNLGTFTPSIPLVNGNAVATFYFTQPTPIYIIGLRLGGVTSAVNIELLDEFGNSTNQVYFPSQNNANVRYTPNLNGIVQINLQSTTSFFIYDIAALNAPAEEFITLDLEEPQWIKEIHTRHWTGTGNASATSMLLGTHLDSLVQVATLNPGDLTVKVTTLPEAIKARYIRVAHTLVQENFKKVTVFEINAFAEPAPEPPLAAVWDSFAGVYPSLSSGEAVTASASSTVGSGPFSPERVIDNDFSTSWVSDNPLPDRYVSNPMQNILLGTLGSSSNQASMGNATDGSLGNMTPIIQPAAGESVAWYSLSIPASRIHRLGLRIAANFSHDVQIQVISTTGQVKNLSYPVGTSGHQRFVVELDDVNQLYLSSAGNFSIQEMAAYSHPLTEHVTVDLGEVKPITWIRTRHWNGNNNSVAAQLLVGATLEDFTEVETLDPSRLDFQNIILSAPINGRYIRIAHQLVDENFKKATVQEITVFDEFGNYGPAPTPKPQERSFGELFGVNTVWAWGTNKVPNMQGPTEGANKFNRVASQARNYHNIHWDTEDPDIAPNYDPANLQVRYVWTQYRQDYSDWQNKGFTVDATFTFDRFPESAWNTPYASAYALGQAFGSYFGPSNENLIRTVEIGNEPWTYSDSTYTQILEGMAQAIKSEDPELFVLPCALQASNPEAGNTGTIKDFMGYKISEAAAPYLDGINLHLYSYIRNDQGIRLAVHPEHPASEMRALFAGLRFRDTNMPGKEVHVTEWGWDSSSTNETAINSEAVSAVSQAVYALRGLFWLSRMGVDRAHWYFFANVNVTRGDTPKNYDRSGLTESLRENFKEKRSFTAVEALKNKMADLHFQEVIREDDTAYIYLLRNQNGENSHLVAWRPVVGDDTVAISTPLPYDFAADSAWHLSGLDPQGEAVSVTYENGRLILPLSSKPLLIQLTHPNASALRQDLTATLATSKEETKLILKTSVPVDDIGQISLTQGTEQGITSLLWEKQDEQTWTTSISQLIPGNYSTQALLEKHLVETNTVHFEIEGSLALFPNPTNGPTQLVLKQTFEQASQVTIIRLDGLVVKALTVPAHTKQIDLPLENLQKGTYVLQLENGSYITKVKFLKK
ncbi:T9SS type A sorting domain-containing protein [Lunatibacter salilacus]|uniref:T9SS type A sorting domain-containing protein n=1 Tax=Lunatibacter salilacus TaxID=2483804 RepID=UPI00131C3699|nr:T9SS type A sorting domain-containing protein [Lunatibacter salilacus]